MTDRQHVVSFSGGKDSTAMLLMMLERGMRVDRVICVDTTKEFPEMYEHIAKVQEMVSPIQIEVVKIDFDYWFGEHVKTRGKRRGDAGYGWPDFRNRWCTALKRGAVSSTGKKRGGKVPENVVEYHGIAYDERERESKNAGRDIRYPLIEWEITEAQALQYCYDRGLDWGGLYEKLSRVSCYLCPLARIGELKVVHDEYPNLWREMQEMDKKSFRNFRSDYSLSELTQRFGRESTQADLGL